MPSPGTISDRGAAAGGAAAWAGSAVTTSAALPSSAARAAPPGMPLLLVAPAARAAADPREPLLDVRNSTPPTCLETIQVVMTMQPAGRQWINVTAVLTSGHAHLCGL
ncbi:hypothetical protein GCM10010433_16260 [Streptomyces pulveraceus]